jgi:hypothetical protein
VAASEPMPDASAVISTARLTHARARGLCCLRMVVPFHWSFQCRRCGTDSYRNYCAAPAVPVTSVRGMMFRARVVLQVDPWGPLGVRCSPKRRQQGPGRSPLSRAASRGNRLSSLRWMCTAEFVRSGDAGRAAEDHCEQIDSPDCAAERGPEAMSIEGG